MPWHASSLKNGRGAHGKHSLYRTTLSLYWFFFSSCTASVTQVTQASMQMSVRVGDDTSACLGLWMHSIFCFSGLPPPTENRWWVLIFSEALHPPSAFLSLVVLYLRTDIHFCVFHAAVCAWMPAFFKPQQSGFDHSGVGLAFSFLLLLF